MKLALLPPSFRALIIGSSGAIGAAFEAALAARPDCGLVVGLHRNSNPAINFDDEGSIEDAAHAVAPLGPFHMIVNAAGLLHSSEVRPEKRLNDLSYDQLLATFTANTFGPALVLRHFSKLLSSEFGVMAHLTAKVGSIGDNRLGGWYSYRASKAALNMIVKTASIELSRKPGRNVLVAIHPGTVRSKLSRPFNGDAIGRTPEIAAAEMLAVLEGLELADTGKFLSYSGEELPW